MPRVTPVVASQNHGTPGDENRVLGTPADIVDSLQDQRFPYRVLALLWYAQQTKSAWIRWTVNGKAFYLPSPKRAKSKEFEEILDSFFGKRWDLIVRSMSEWGYELTIQKPYVYDGSIVDKPKRYRK